jgi:chemotaxis protein histidine kinase CheA
MAHQDIPEAGVTRALAFGLRMTPAEIAKGRYMRAPDHDAAPSRGEMQASVQDFIADQFLGGADEPEEETDEIPEGDEPEGEEAEGDTPEAEETTDENSEAPEPIAAPVSWDKDAKEAFAQLPRELQATVAEREAQRDKAIQSATTEAANAKRNALAEANAMFADQQRQYAQHLEQLAAQNAPQRPDPALAAQDPGAYVQGLAYFEAHNAQHQELMQQAAHAKNEATRREAITRQHEIAKDQEALATALGDDWTDTGKRQALLTSLQEVGATLGYPVELMGQANATDILALLRQRRDGRPRPTNTMRSRATRWRLCGLPRMRRAWRSRAPARPAPNVRPRSLRSLGRSEVIARQERRCSAAYLRKHGHQALSPDERQVHDCSIEYDPERGPRGYARGSFRQDRGAFPRRYPFMNAIGKGKATATKTEWQTDGLTAANATNAKIQGDDLANESRANTVRVGSFTQISTKVVGVSSTVEATATRLAARASWRARS